MWNERGKKYNFLAWLVSNIYYFWNNTIVHSSGQLLVSLWFLWFFFNFFFDLTVTFLTSITLLTFAFLMLMTTTWRLFSRFAIARWSTFWSVSSAIPVRSIPRSRSSRWKKKYNYLLNILKTINRSLEYDINFVLHYTSRLPRWSRWMILSIKVFLNETLKTQSLWNLVKMTN